MNFNFWHIHHIDKNFLSEILNYHSPVFVLNTGRSGSAKLQEIFDLFDESHSYHEANPNLMMLSDYAFHNQDKDEVLTKIFEAARMELILEAAIDNKIYIETNQCLVFYIHQIINLFPNAKFVHLLRHPGDFVASAIRKGWHLNDSIWELGRLKSLNEGYWNKLTHVEKLTWVWNETHNFVEVFKRANQENCYTVRFEDLVTNEQTIDELVSFVGLDYSKQQNAIMELIGKKKNEIQVYNNEPPRMKKNPDFPNYKVWGNELKSELKNFVSNLAEQYEYKID